MKCSSLAGFAVSIKLVNFRKISQTLLIHENRSKKRIALTSEKVQYMINEMFQPLRGPDLLEEEICTNTKKKKPVQTGRRNHIIGWELTVEIYNVIFS